VECLDLVFFVLFLGSFSFFVNMKDVIKIKKNIKLLSLVLLFVICIYISHCCNNSYYLDSISFIRVPINVFFIYIIVDRYISCSNNIRGFFLYLIVIGLIQLPVVLVQRFMFDYYPLWLKAGRFTSSVSIVDFMTGTFNGDAIMTFYFLILIIILLFDRTLYLKKLYRYIFSTYFSLIVLISNSQIQHLTLLFIWIVFILLEFNLKTILILTVFIPLFLFILSWCLEHNVVTDKVNFSNTPNKILQLKYKFADQQNFVKFSGRQYALNTMLNNKLEIIGEGPGYIYSTYSNKLKLFGRCGQVFIYYFEIGLLGLLVSIYFMFMLTFNGYNIQIDKSYFIRILFFISLLILSFSKNPLNNSSLVFIYCIGIKYCDFVGKHVSR